MSRCGCTTLWVRRFGGPLSIRRATTLAALLVLFSIGSLAQDRALISGDTEDKQDTPVSGVLITLRNDSLRVARTTTTNSDGLYFFSPRSFLPRVMSCPPRPLA